MLYKATINSIYYGYQHTRRGYIQEVKMRSVELNKGLVTRLNRIEGQIKGIKRMVESGEECEDIMIQILAIQGAIRQVGQKVVMNHLNNCIVESIQTGSLDEVQKFSKILDKFIAK